MGKDALMVLNLEGTWSLPRVSSSCPRNHLWTVTYRALGILRSHVVRKLYQLNGALEVTYLKTFFFPEKEKKKSVRSQILTSGNLVLWGHHCLGFPNFKVLNK